MTGFSRDNRPYSNNPLPRFEGLEVPTQGPGADSRSKGPLRLDFKLNWEPLESEMNTIFENRFGAPYPLNCSDLDTLKSSNIISGITEARDFVVDSMKNWPHLSGKIVDHDFVRSLERKLAERLKVSYDLP